MHQLLVERPLVHCWCLLLKLKCFLIGPSKTNAFVDEIQIIYDCVLFSLIFVFCCLLFYEHWPQSFCAWILVKTSFVFPSESLICGNKRMCTHHWCVPFPLFLQSWSKYSLVWEHPCIGRGLHHRGRGSFSQERWVFLNSWLETGFLGAIVSVVERTNG